MNMEADHPAPRKSVGRIVADALTELWTTLVAFVKAPRALWGINVPFILEGLCYFGILTILGKFCSENVALDDVISGWVYMGVTGGITLAMLLLGGVSDRIGVRASLALSLGVMAIGRAVVSLSDTLPLGEGVFSPMFFVMAFGLLMMVAAYGLYQPAAYAGVKRYTNPRTAAMGYAVLYALMNLGAFIFGFMSPPIRRASESLLPPNGLGGVLWTVTAITALSCVLTLLLITRRVDRNAVERVARESAEINAANGSASSGKDAVATDQNHAVARTHLTLRQNLPFLGYLLVALVLLVSVLLVYTGRLQVAGALADRATSIALTVVVGCVALWEFLRHRPDHPFRDGPFVFFIFVLMPVQTLFAHNWLTIPYYLDRAFAGSWVGANFELFSNINPLLIFVFTPIVAGLTARANEYNMMIVGTFVMAVPTFLLVLGPNPVLFMIYILLMSIGEAIWQPRFLQWIAEIAPPGRTGAYMGIGQFPWFLTKVVTAFYSGWFVQNYIPLPDAGLPMRTSQLWFIYALIAMVTPVALVLARHWMMSRMREKHA